MDDFEDEFDDDMDDLGLDDMMDEMGDLEALTNPTPPKNIREAVTGTLKNVKSDLLDNTIDEPMEAAKDFAKRAIPDSVAPEANAIIDVTDSISDEFSKAADEVKGVAKKTLTSVESVLPDVVANNGLVKDVLGKVHSWLGDSSTDEDNTGPSEEEIRMANITETIVTAMGEQQSSDTIDSLIKEQMEANRHKTSVELMSNISANVDRSRKFQYEIANSYYRRSLEVQYQQLFVARDQLNVLKTGTEAFKNQLEAIVKNTSLPDMVKINNAEILEHKIKSKVVDTVGESFFGEGTAFGNLKNNAIDLIKEKKDKVIAGLMEGKEAADGAADGPDMDPMMVAGMFLGDAAKNFMGSKVGKYIESTEFGKTAINKTKSFVNDPTKHLDDLADNEDISTFRGKVLNGLFSTMADLTKGKAIKTELGKTKDPSAAAFFDNRTHTTLNMVIPNLLSKIHSEVAAIRDCMGCDKDVSGNELKFDYEKGTMVTSSKLKSDLTSKIKNSAKDATDSVDSIIDTLKDKAGLELNDNEKSKFKNGVLRYVLEGGSTSVNKLHSSKFLNYFDDYLRNKIESSVDVLINKSKTDTKLNASLTDSLNSVKKNAKNHADKLIKMHDSGHGSLLEEMGITTTTDTGITTLNKDKYLDMYSGKINRSHVDGYGEAKSNSKKIKEAKNAINKLLKTQQEFRDTQTDNFRSAYKVIKNEDGERALNTVKDIKNNYKEWKKTQSTTDLLKHDAKNLYNNVKDKEFKIDFNYTKVKRKTLVKLEKSKRFIIEEFEKLMKSFGKIKFTELTRLKKKIVDKLSKFATKHNLKVLTPDEEELERKVYNGMSAMGMVKLPFDIYLLAERKFRSFNSYINSILKTMSDVKAHMLDGLSRAKDSFNNNQHVIDAKQSISDLDKKYGVTDSDTFKKASSMVSETKEIFKDVKGYKNLVDDNTFSKENFKVKKGAVKNYIVTAYKKLIKFLKGLKPSDLSKGFKAIKAFVNKHSIKFVKSDEIDFYKDYHNDLLSHNETGIKNFDMFLLSNSLMRDPAELLKELISNIGKSTTNFVNGAYKASKEAYKDTSKYIADTDTNTMKDDLLKNGKSKYKNAKKYTSDKYDTFIKDGKQYYKDAKGNIVEVYNDTKNSISNFKKNHFATTNFIQNQHSNVRIAKEGKPVEVNKWSDGKSDTKLVDTIMSNKQIKKLVKKYESIVKSFKEINITQIGSNIVKPMSELISKYRLVTLNTEKYEFQRKVYDGLKSIGMTKDSYDIWLLKNGMVKSPEVMVKEIYAGAAKLGSNLKGKLDNFGMPKMDFSIKGIKDKFTETLDKARKKFEDTKHLIVVTPEQEETLRFEFFSSPEFKSGDITNFEDYLHSLGYKLKDDNLLLRIDFIRQKLDKFRPSFIMNKAKDLFSKYMEERKLTKVNEKEVEALRFNFINSPEFQNGSITDFDLWLKINGYIRIENTLKAKLKKNFGLKGILAKTRAFDKKIAGKFYGGIAKGVAAPGKAIARSSKMYSRWGIDKLAGREQSDEVKAFMEEENILLKGAKKGFKVGRTLATPITGLASYAADGVASTVGMGWKGVEGSGGNLEKARNLTPLKVVKGAGKLAAGTGKAAIKYGVAAPVKGVVNVAKGANYAADGLASTVGLGWKGIGDGSRTIDKVKNKIGFSKGGYTGDGAKHEVAGTVHKGEYVISKQVLGNLVNNESNLERIVPIIMNIVNDVKSKSKLHNKVTLKEKIHDSTIGKLTKLKNRVMGKIYRKLKLSVKDPTVATITLLSSIKDGLVKKKKSVFDRDGDGDRDGNWKDRLSSLSKKPAKMLAAGKKMIAKVAGSPLLKMIATGVMGLAAILPKLLGGMLSGILKLPKLLSGLGGLLSKGFSKLPAALSKAKDLAVKGAKFVGEHAGSFATEMAAGAKNLASKAMSGVKNVAGNVMSKVGDFASGAKSFVSKGLSKVGDMASSVGSKIGKVAKSKGIVGKIIGMLKSFKGVLLKKFGKKAGGMLVTKLVGKIAARAIPFAGQALLAYDAAKIGWMTLHDGMSLKSAISQQILGFDLFGEDLPKDDKGQPIVPDAAAKDNKGKGNSDLKAGIVESKDTKSKTLSKLSNGKPGTKAPINPDLQAGINNSDAIKKQIIEVDKIKHTKQTISRDSTVKDNWAKRQMSVLSDISYTAKQSLAEHTKMVGLLEKIADTLDISNVANKSDNTPKPKKEMDTRVPSHGSGSSTFPKPAIAVSRTRFS